MDVRSEGAFPLPEFAALIPQTSQDESQQEMTTIKPQLSSILLSGGATLLTLLLANCGSTSPGSTGRSSAGLDEWGNRPGPRGFGTVVVDAGHGGKDSGARS